MGCHLPILGLQLVQEMIRFKVNLILEKAADCMQALYFRCPFICIIGLGKQFRQFCHLFEWFCLRPSSFDPWKHGRLATAWLLLEPDVIADFTILVGRWVWIRQWGWGWCKEQIPLWLLSLLLHSLVSVSSNRCVNCSLFCNRWSDYCSQFWSCCHLKYNIFKSFSNARYIFQDEN